MQVQRLLSIFKCLFLATTTTFLSILCDVQFYRIQMRRGVLTVLTVNMHILFEHLCTCKIYCLNAMYFEEVMVSS